ncbi:hypothetical protein RND71_004042 [Anisodus tanguticus]|uniref:DUF4378 domain-containing protein n=1 Tax=Anisodus tanguticus TaxID=243964 RepID=A0AAE1SXU4_9SOLA|nr:hypothetical protein RND71_004042 [Anisodus tanguticus]
MAQKHLHELLKEDQEPFYIATKTSLVQIKKQKPIIQNQTSSTSKLCKNTCFFSFNDSPEVRESPLYMKSPENGKVFLHVPARTATLLLEAAMRIQKQQSSSKPKTQIKKVKFGVFGSILKKLKDRHSKKNGENIVRISTTAETRNAYEEKFNDDDFGSCPLSPFRFSLQRCSSSGDVMPEFTSPAGSPVRHKKEDIENYETIALASHDKLEEEEDDDEKEQCSPVSVLDPPFDQEEDGHEDGDEDEEEDCDFDCSYGLVQRAQQQLLYKLRRFEKLTVLDPIELEKLLLEDPAEDDKDFQVLDLNSEETSEVKSLNYGEAVFGRECKRLDSSQELRSNTINMMIKSEFDEWNKFQEQREETAIEFSCSIFALLIEELGEELIHLAHC